MCYRCAAPTALVIACFPLNVFSTVCELAKHWAFFLLYKHGPIVTYDAGGLQCFLPTTHFPGFFQKEHRDVLPDLKKNVKKILQVSVINFNEFFSLGQFFFGNDIFLGLTGPGEIWYLCFNRFFEAICWHRGMSCQLRLGHVVNYFVKPPFLFFSPLSCVSICGGQHIGQHSPRESAGALQLEHYA